jgi:hypothetical protein
MSQMPLLSVVLYIATRLWLEGDAVDESIVPLLKRAGLPILSREIAADDASSP